MNYANVNRLLTFAVPTAIEQEVFEFLLVNPKFASSFSATHARAIGAGIELSSAIERVQGHARQTLIYCLGEQGALMELVDAAKQEFPDANISYWTVAVADFGKFK